MARKPKSARPNIVRVVIEAARQRRGDDPRPASKSRILGLTKFAEDMGVSVTAVQKWLSTGIIPAENGRVIRAEELSGVPRQRIRPDVYPPESRRLLTPSSVSVP